MNVINRALKNTGDEIERTRKNDYFSRYIFILETNNLSHLKIELLSGLQLPDLT